METSDIHDSNPSEDGNAKDTIALARRDQLLQGPWEAEYSYGGEGDLKRHEKGCLKNPGHVEFIPVDTFNLTHLPEGCQDKDLMDLIQCLAEMTCRVSVSYTSYRRPEVYPRSETPYPSYTHRNNEQLRVGTGWLWRVNVFPNDYLKDCTTCSCEQCKYNPTPNTQFAHIHFYTAAHVVFDWVEAAHASCDLFFDKGGKPRPSNGVVTLKGFSAAWHNSDDDSCEIRYVTHDLELADRLSKLERRWNSLVQIIGNKMRPLALEKIKLPPQVYSESDPKRKLVIMVSHPHGCSKQISVGHYTKRNVVEGGMSWYIYNVATCPGSSGAKVLILDRGSQVYYYTSHVHGGSGDDKGNDQNFSGYGFEGFDR